MDPSPQFTQPTQEKIPTESRRRIEQIFQAAGVDLNTVEHGIVKRVELLHKKSNTLEDEFNAIKLASDFFGYYETRKKENSFSPEEQRAVYVGTLFSDIGKTGPKDASPELSNCITEIYSIDDPVSPTMSLEAFLNQFFPDDTEQRKVILQKNGLDPTMTMRQFFNQHVEWTTDILKGSKIPAGGIIAASTHHTLEGLNPSKILMEDGNINPIFGPNEKFDRSKKLVLLLDKYDARRRRGKKSHEESIAWLKDFLSKNARWSNDPEFNTLIEDMDATFENSLIYYKE